MSMYLSHVSATPNYSRALLLVFKETAALGSLSNVNRTRLAADHFSSGAQSLVLAVPDSLLLPLSYAHQTGLTPTTHPSPTRPLLPAPLRERKIHLPKQR